MSTRLRASATLTGLFFHWSHVRLLRNPHPPDARPPGTPPPPGLLAFYWHFVRQTRGLYAAMFATGLAVALIDTLDPGLHRPARSP